MSNLLSVNTQEVLPCEQCPVFQTITSETRDEFMEAAEQMAAQVGQTAIDALWEKQRAYIDAIKTGAVNCSGYTPIKPGWRKAIKLFDGDTGLSFVENNQCHNTERRGEASVQLSAARKDVLKQRNAAFRESIKR